VKPPDIAESSAQIEFHRSSMPYMLVLF
jgi:hypothetical protein